MWPTRSIIFTTNIITGTTKMKFKFTKMHSLGNDFIVIDGVRQNIHLSQKQIAFLGNRHLGIGFDQCLIVESSSDLEVDFFYRIYNSNGQEVGQCGNGARCLMSFIKKQGLSSKDTITVATKTTKMQLFMLQDNVASVAMDTPQLDPKKIPILAPTRQQWYTLSLTPNEKYEIHAINVGNPHAVLIVDDSNLDFVNRLGKKISEHPLFPEQANVGFMHIVDASNITLRVYERDCGETSACGSGALAAAALGRLYHNMNEKIVVTMPGGSLEILWPDITSSIYLNGPTAFVFDGVIEDLCA